MPAPLSQDLRTRVFMSLESGIKIEEVSRIFKVSERAIYNWKKLRKETQSLEPKSGYQKGHSHKITDLEVFKTFVDTNKNCSTEELAKRWGVLYNTTVSNNTIKRAFRKIGYTFKKKLWL